MSPELVAILEDIRDNPEEDLPRLALADWCQEQADVPTQQRGEFIHLRCRAAALPLNHPERIQLEARAARLCQLCEKDWLGQLANHLVGWTFDRGMILAEVSESTLPRLWSPQLTSCPEWFWVLGIRGLCLDDIDVNTLFKSPALSGLTTLDLRDCSPRLPSMRTLCQAAEVQTLTVLYLDYCQLTDEAVQSLTQSAQLARLRTLSLAANWLTRLSADRLARCENWPRLTKLVLDHNPLGDQGLRHLLHIGRLPELRTLSLQNCQLTDRSADLLKAASPLEGLALLDLRDNAFSDRRKSTLRRRFGTRVTLSP